MIKRERIGGGQTNHPSTQGLESTTRISTSRQSSRRSISRSSNVSRTSSRGSFSGSRASSRGSNRGGGNDTMMRPEDYNGGGGGGGGGGRTMSRSSNTDAAWNRQGNTGLPPNYQQASPRGIGDIGGAGGNTGRPPLSSPRPMLGPNGGSTVKDRVLRNILQKSGNAAAYVRPAGNYMNKNQELFDIKLEEDLHDVKDLHNTSRDPTQPDARIAKEIDARATQVENFLKLNDKLSIPKAYYDPRFEQMDKDSVVDELVQSRNFTGRMRQLRMKRARILLNSSEGVQACVSPRDGYGSHGQINHMDNYLNKHKNRYKQLMKTSAKAPEDKVNHMIRNPTTYHINHVSVYIHWDRIKYVFVWYSVNSIENRLITNSTSKQN